MRELNILVHPGFIKTSTTWMQKQVFPNLKNCVYLGVPFVNKKLFETHAQLFNRLFLNNLYRSRNSEKIIDQYVEVLKEEIIQRFPKSNNNAYFILSNETIFDYANYNGELNTYLLCRLLKKLRESLDDFCKMTVSILVTFREQSSVLQSFYTFDYARLKREFPTFDKFLSYGAKYTHNRIFGSLWYDEIFQQLQDIFKGDKLLFVPYEFLNENPTLFLEKSLGDFGGSSLEELTRIAKEGEEPVNVNRNKTGDYMLKGISKRHELVNYLVVRKHYLPEKYYPILNSLKTWILPLCGKQSVIEGAFKMNAEQQKIIQDLYGDSNRRLSDMIGVDLGHLGYSLRSNNVPAPSQN